MNGDCCVPGRATEPFRFSRQAHPAFLSFLLYCRLTLIHSFQHHSFAGQSFRHLCYLHLLDLPFQHFGRFIRRLSPRRRSSLPCLASHQMPMIFLLPGIAHTLLSPPVHPVSQTAPLATIPMPLASQKDPYVCLSSLLHP